MAVTVALEARVEMVQLVLMHLIFMDMLVLVVKEAQVVLVAKQEKVAMQDKMALMEKQEKQVIMAKVEKMVIMEMMAIIQQATLME